MEQKRTSGILLHPTSLPSSFAIGDFGKNSFQFVDVLKRGKQTLWQMLPLCPVDSTDSPYQSPSAFAGEPLLIDLEKLVDLSLLTADEVNAVRTHDQGKTDYAMARRIKRPLFQVAFERFQENEKVFATEFKAFIKAEAHWLEGYALFMAAKNHFVEERATNTPEVQKEREAFAKNCKSVLKADDANNYFNGASWVSFPKGLRDFDEKAIVEYKTKFANEYNYYIFLQFLFDMQWKDLKAYANKNDVKIVGDIPIFVSYDSADVWQNQQDFILDKLGFPVGVAGVPPDYFSETGQLWGNPLYNFKNQKKNKFEWWYLRLKKAFEVSDIVRLDHFRGFESFWQVPFGSKDAKSGEWVSSAGLPFFKEMEKRFDTKDLPIIAEDLGVITEEVKTLKEATG
ncbi:MAG: 4-alpha-glucanotransferase, partial [Bacillota bacterium]